MQSLNQILKRVGTQAAEGLQTLSEEAVAFMRGAKKAIEVTKETFKDQRKPIDPRGEVLKSFPHHAKRTEVFLGSGCKRDVIAPETWQTGRLPCRGKDFYGAPTSNLSQAVHFGCEEEKKEKGVCCIIEVAVDAGHVETNEQFNTLFVRSHLVDTAVAVTAIYAVNQEAFKEPPTLGVAGMQALKRGASVFQATRTAEKAALKEARLQKSSLRQETQRQHKMQKQPQFRTKSH